jgi:hypothetical protein
MSIPPYNNESAHCVDTRDPYHQPPALQWLYMHTNLMLQINALHMCVFVIGNPEKPMR